MEHTPGPWRAYCLGSEGYQVRRDNDGVPAATIKESFTERMTPIVYAMGGSFEAQKANAHLIAAAPDLLEALLAVYQDIEIQDVPGGSDELNFLVQQSIKKARGEA